MKFDTAQDDSCSIDFEFKPNCNIYTSATQDDHKPGNPNVMIKTDHHHAGSVMGYAKNSDGTFRRFAIQGHHYIRWA